MNKARQARLTQPPPQQQPPQPPSQPQRQQIPIGPATLDVFAQVLAAADVSKAQMLTLLEANGLTNGGNYRLVITGALLVPAE